MPAGGSPAATPSAPHVTVVSARPADWATRPPGHDCLTVPLSGHHDAVTSHDPADKPSNLPGGPPARRSALVRPGARERCERYQIQRFSRWTSGQASTSPHVEVTKL